MRAVVVSGMALIAATYGLARFGYGLFLPQLTEAFRIDSTVAGAVQAGSFLSYCLAAVLAARLGGRPRAVVGYAGATAAVGAAGVAAAPGVVVLTLGVVLAGAGAGFATPGLVALVERNVPAARQEAAQTVVNAGTGAGIVAAGILMFLTVGHWRLGWWAIAALAALATIASLRADRAGTRAAAGDGRPTPRIDDLGLLRAPLAAAVLAGAGSAAVWTFGRSVMAESLPGAETPSVVAWMVLGAFGVLGAAAATIVQRWSLATAWSLTSLTMAAATTALGLAPGVPAVAYSSAALFGASYTALSGVLIVWAVRLLPDRSAAGTVALFIALALGQAAGSVSLGVLLGRTSAVLTFAVAGVLGVVAVLPAVRRHPDAAPHPSVTSVRALEGGRR